MGCWRLRNTARNGRVIGSIWLATLAWENTVRADLAKAPQPLVLEVAEFRSLAGSSFKTLEDGSVLLTGDAPNKDTYVVTVRTKLKGITGFKIEALADASLGGKKGPGRADEPNFVLNNFKVTATSERGAEAVKLVAAAASFSQPGFPIERLLRTDNEATAGWAVGSEVHRDHWAVFKTAKQLGFAGETLLTFRLEQDFGGVRTIGRLRLSAFTGPELPVAAGRSVPSDIVAILDAIVPQRTEAQTRRLTEFYRAEDKNLERMRVDKANLEKSLRDLGEGRSLVMEELRTRSAVSHGRGNDPRQCARGRGPAQSEARRPSRASLPAAGFVGQQSRWRLSDVRGQRGGRRLSPWHLHGLETVGAVPQLHRLRRFSAHGLHHKTLALEHAAAGSHAAQ
jgi:hypothetical protein